MPRAAHRKLSTRRKNIVASIKHNHLGHFNNSWILRQGNPHHCNYVSSLSTTDSASKTLARAFYASSLSLSYQISICTNFPWIRSRGMPYSTQALISIVCKIAWPGWSMQLLFIPMVIPRHRSIIVHICRSFLSRFVVTLITQIVHQYRPCLQGRAPIRLRVHDQSSNKVMSPGQDHNPVHSPPQFRKFV